MSETDAREESVKAFFASKAAVPLVSNIKNAMNERRQLDEAWDRLRLYEPSIGYRGELNIIKYVSRNHGWKVAAIKKSTPGELAKLIQRDVEECESQIDKNAKRILTAQPAGQMQEPPVKPSRASLKEPTKDAFAAYKVHKLLGKNQPETATILTKQFSRPVTQGQVSRWCKAVAKWTAAGGLVPPELTMNPTVRSVDPDVLEMGQRVDGRTPRQRERRDDR